MRKTLMVKYETLGNQHNPTVQRVIVEQQAYLLMQIPSCISQQVQKLLENMSLLVLNEQIILKSVLLVSIRTDFQFYLKNQKNR